MQDFFDQISILLNIVGVSCKRHDMLRNARLENVKKALETVVKLNLEPDYIKRWIYLGLEILDGDLITKLYVASLPCMKQSMMY